MPRTLRRLVMFGLARFTDSATYAVRRPPGIGVPKCAACVRSSRPSIRACWHTATSGAWLATGPAPCAGAPDVVAS